MPKDPIEMDPVGALAMLEDIDAIQYLSED